MINTKWQIPNYKYQMIITKLQIPSTKYQMTNTKWQIPSVKYQMPDIEINWLLESTRSLPSSLRRLWHPWPTIAHSWWSLGWKQVIQGSIIVTVIAIFIIIVKKVFFCLGICDSWNPHFHRHSHFHHFDHKGFLWVGKRWFKESSLSSSSPSSLSWSYDASGLQLCYSTWANWSEVVLPFSRLAWQSNQSEHDCNAFFDGNDDISVNDYFGQCWWFWWQDGSVPHICNFFVR